MDLGDSLRSVSWNHLKPNIVAAGSFKGTIFIIDVDKYKFT